MSKVKCVAVKRGVFSDKVKLFSEGGASVVFGSFFGDREFYINPGRSVTVKVPKRWWVEVGEERDLDDWITSSNAWDLAWRWAY